MNESHHQLALPQGTYIQDFQFDRVLGQDSFGITYLGWNMALDIPVAIKEYLPSDFATRESDMSVVPRSSQVASDFAWGLDDFLKEARRLAQFNHPNIVRVHHFFEAHGTAYIVMDYVEGETLSSFLERRGTLSEEETGSSVTIPPSEPRPAPPPVIQDQARDDTPPVHQCIDDQSAPPQKSKDKLFASIVCIVAALIGGGYYYESVPAQQRQAQEATETEVAQERKKKISDRLSGAREAERQIGMKFKDCADCPEMVVVPSGSFTMGSPSGEYGRDDDEGPRHLVIIDYPLAVGVYEVTFSEWDACVADGGCGGYVPDDDGWGRGNRPVMNVSWNHAQSYVRWLCSKTGHNYGLLSESEWEYVARAGTETRYSWGNKIGHNRANCDGCGSRWDDDRTAPVGSFSANGWGVYDMHGNVWEWVQDCWNDSYVGAPVDGSSWESGDCCNRVRRGGSGDFSSRWLRSAIRSWDPPDYRNDDFGFRVARRF